MKKCMIAISCLIFAIPCLKANAQMTLDIAKITCEQFVTYKITNPNNIALWLSGYYNGKRGNTIIDTLALTESSKKLQDYCLEHLQVPVMQAAEKIYGPN
jgi:acid stress chaperone HdeB